MTKLYRLSSLVGLVSIARLFKVAGLTLGDRCLQVDTDRWTQDAICNRIITLFWGANAVMIRRYGRRVQFSSI